MKHVIQLKIRLEGIKPEIWRRFLIEDSISFRELHNIIQAVMGWENYHLYEFKINGKRIVPPEEGFNLAESSFRDLHSSPEFQKMLDGQDLSKGSAMLDADKLNEILEKERKNKKKPLSVETPVNNVIDKERIKFNYTYDFGDMWVHSITVEKISENDNSGKYPVCMGGERACPPEDCGSVPGYEDLMEIRKNKKHPQYKEKIVEWLGEEYDPELFVVDLVNAMLHGEKPAPAGVHEEGKEEFIQLGKLLKKDNDDIKEIKSLFNRESEYESYLGAIEFTIADYFLENRKLKDKDVEKAIKNIKKNYMQGIGFFKNELEKEIMLRLSLALQEEQITHHELNLVFDYVLWSIDNRSWMPDKQAFVKWLPYFFGLYDEKESEKYKRNLTKIARRMGVPQTQLDAMLNMEGAGLPDEQKKMTGLESEFFSLDDDKKFDFVVENGLTNPCLVQSYIIELDKKEDFGIIEKLCKKLMELTNNFPMFEFLLGLNYENMRNPVLAKHHMENAVKTMGDTPPDFFPPGEREKMLGDMRKEMRRMK